MRVIVEVEHPQGVVKSGISGRTNKPYAMAEQEAAVFMDGVKYPVTGTIDVQTRNVRLHEGNVLCDVSWHKPGRYETRVVLETDQFRRIRARLVDRDLKPLLAEVAPPKVGKAA